MDNFTPKNLFQIIKLKEIFYLIFVQLIIKYGFIDFFSFLDNELPTKYFIFILISTGFIASFGYLMNSYTNSKNLLFKKNKLILLYSILFTAIGLCSGVIASIQTKKPYNIVIFIISWLIVLVASKLIKSRCFLKDLLLSFFAASSVLVIWWFVKPEHLDLKHWLLFSKLSITITLFTILIFNAVLVKFTFLSLKYLSYDRKSNNPTLSVVFGIKKTKSILLLISVICNFFTLIISYFYIGNLNVFFVLFLIILVHMPIIHRKVKKAKTEKDYSYILKVLEISFFIITPLFIITTAIIIKNAYN